MSLLRLCCFDLVTSSPGGDSFQLSWVPPDAVLCGVHHTMCRHTQAFPLLHNHSSSLAFSAADTCLTKQADACTSSFSMLLSVFPLSTSRQNSLTGGWGSLQDIGLWDDPWHPFRRVPRKPAAPQGGGDSVSPSTACVISNMCK